MAFAAMAFVSCEDAETEQLGNSPANVVLLKRKIVKSHC